MANPVVVQATVVEEGPPMPGPPVVQGSVVGRPVQVVMGSGAGAPVGSTQRGPAEDPTVLAILACCCCCWCTGILAIIQARSVVALNDRGDYDRAHQARTQAMNLIYVSVGLGILIGILNTVFASMA